MKHPRYLDLIPRIGVLSKPDFSQITEPQSVFLRSLEGRPLVSETTSNSGSFRPRLGCDSYPPHRACLKQHLHHKPHVEHDGNRASRRTHHLDNSDVASGLTSRLEKDPKNHLFKKRGNKPLMKYHQAKKCTTKG